MAVSPTEVSSRRQSRERALSLLYEAEAKGLTPAALLEELPAPPDPFAAALVRGVGEHLERLDDLIAGRAIGWSLDRMPAVDRNVCRMAAYELAECPDVPVAVAISEAVELAKRFSTEESGRFVNGLLAAVSAEVRPAGPPGGAGPVVPRPPAGPC